MALAQQSAFQNGAAFPDWGYSCGWPDESEAAHWPPFTVATVLYIHKTCGAYNASLESGGWDDHCQKLGSFLMGVVSHQVADVLWHDLAIVSPSKQGFIEAMAYTDFGQDYHEAHTAADTGGEFIVAEQFDLSFIKEQWYVPADDLQEIYALLGYTNVTSKDISECNTLLYAEVHAVKDGGAALYSYAGDKSTFLTDELLHYFMGGLDDNAVWTYWCWSSYLTQWLLPDGGDQHPLCLAQQDFSSASGKTSEHGNAHLFRAGLFSRADLGWVGRAVESLPNGTVHMRNNATDVLSNGGSVLPSSAPAATASDRLQRDECSAASGGDGDISLTLTLDAEYAYLGDALAAGDLDGDGRDDLVVAAPGYSTVDAAGAAAQVQSGLVYIVAGRALSASSSVALPVPGGGGAASDVRGLQGWEARGRFGTGAAVVDWNGDGVLDIAVSSPGAGGSQLQYNGSVAVYFGHANSSLDFGISPTALNSTPNVLITTSEPYSNLGTTLVGKDIDGDGTMDLVICSPFYGMSKGEKSTQEGLVSIFFGGQSDTSNQKRASTYYTDVSKADWTMHGELASAWFGYSVDIATLANGTRILLVGSPKYNPSTSGASESDDYGMIYGISVATRQVVWRLMGSEKFDQVGTSFAFGNFSTEKQPRGPTLALPLVNKKKPSFGGKSEGVVLLVSLNDSKFQGTMNISSVQPFATLYGTTNFERFGMNVGFESAEQSTAKVDRLWVSSPRWRSSDTTPQVGRVYYWNSGQRLQGSESASSSSTECYQGGSANERYGSRVVPCDFDGDGMLDMVSSSPRASSTLNGYVTILKQQQ
eukprot:TRINITY_DN8947_c0_g1_i1.p1 TRINITY_DN8947_c0_g1~~TRINITY_DN8947_c0_g1_i1.p1  ORF type:complete len:826 (+),score=141.24 TRINITY_DN8947_c0_g1_i1:30-2480(+)